MIQLCGMEVRWRLFQHGSRGVHTTAQLSVRRQGIQTVMFYFPVVCQLDTETILVLRIGLWCRRLCVYILQVNRISIHSGLTTWCIIKTQNKKSQYVDIAWHRLNVDTLLKNFVFFRSFSLMCQVVNSCKLSQNAPKLALSGFDDFDIIS